MAFPPGFLDELKTRLSLASVVGRKVTWDPRKSNAGKGDYWAPCPFHQEKTASFHVDDRKGFYYCFGCQAKGDALNFVRETENVDFIEAVKILAAEAGMTVPAQDPRAAARAEKRAGLTDVMDMAVRYYRMQLNSAAAADARAYLDTRGLSAETQDRFEIGFAPNARTELRTFLTDKQVPEALMVEAGLVIKPDDGGAAYDRFRDRIMFPIRDARGRAIAFGGRAMAADARAKYLNSPETPLFDKGRTLYHHAPAREAAGKAGTVIVAEGYMDVIALAAAGFAHAVAPLGTAITEDQLRLMWRMADEPVIALDGDAAGSRAAMRLIDLALPMLEAGKTLRFVILPDGQDPDDILRASGPAAMDKLLTGARPLVDLLWQRETEGRVLDSPERRAGLDASLRAAIGKIADPSVRAHYQAEIRTRRAALFAPQRQDGPRRGGAFKPGRPGPARPSAGARNSFLAQNARDEAVETRLREAALLCACLNHPAAIPLLETDLETLPFTNADHARFRDALLEAAQGTDFSALLDTLVERPLRDKITALGNPRAAPYIRPRTDHDTLVRALREDMARHRAILGQREEVDDAARDMTGEIDEGVTWRLAEAAAAHAKAAAAPTNDDDSDRDQREEMSNYLQQLIDQQSWKKRKS